MAGIDIRHPHSLPAEQARDAVEEIARKLAERFGVRYGWEGDRLDFSGSGVEGRIALEPEQLHVTASLGFLLGMMKDPIEAEIRRVLGEKFGT